MPPDPREGFNPPSTIVDSSRPHVLRAACLRIQANAWRTVMGKNLPARPNLDHLRSQAKALLAALEVGDADAVATIREHLPAAKGLKAEQIRALPLRLADAQSAIARKTGFATWPQLGRHVDQLRALEGTWSFAHLEIDGHVMPA